MGVLYFFFAFDLVVWWCGGGGGGVVVVVVGIYTEYHSGAGRVFFQVAMRRFSGDM